MKVETVGSLLWQARISRVLILALICCTFVGLGWYQPNVADAETLSAPVSIPVATTPRSTTAAYVVMSRITATSSGTVLDGKVELNSLTLSNPGTANVAVGRVYLSTTATATLPADAVQIGRTRGSLWTAGATTTILLSSGTTTQRTVLTTTPGFIYIVFDMLSTQATRTTSALVTAIGVVTTSGDTNPGAMSLSSNVITLSASSVIATIVNCTDCHGDVTTASFSYMDGARSASTGSFVGSHNKHVGSMTYLCTACHSGGALSATNTGHRDNYINMANPTLLYGGIYNKAPSFSFPQSSSPVMNTCTTVYCHSSGAGTNSTATWGATGSMPADCTGCHGGNVSSAASIATNAHDRHIASAAVGFAITCDRCHSATVSADRTISTPASHVNNTINVRFNNVINLDSDAPTYNGNAATSVTVSGSQKAPLSPVGSCNNVYCHSSGNLTAAGGTIVVSGTVPTYKNQIWSGTIGCDGCHGGAGLAHPTYTGTSGGSTTANSHVKHVEGSSLGCTFCHNLTTSGTGTTAASLTLLSGGTTSHLNRIEDVSFSLNGGATGVYNATVGNKTCSANYCHGVTNTSPSWGGVTTCKSCHEATNSVTGLSARHIQHYNTTVAPLTLSDPNSHGTTSYAYGCSNCHPTGTHSQGPAILNFQDAQVGGSRLAPYTAGLTSLADTQGYKYTVGGTCTTNCHTRDGVASAPVVTPFWNGAATGACNVCHRASGENYSTMTTTATRLSMTHAIHMANDRYAGGQPTNFTCEACHTTVAANNTSLQTTTTARTQHVSGTKDVSFGAFPGATGVWNGTQCSNTYCHSNGTAAAGTHAVISWSTATATNCGSCHAALPATNAHAKHLATSTWLSGAITCDDCHNATASSNVSVSSFTYHANKNVTIQFNAASSGATATYNGNNTAGGASVYQKLPGSTVGSCGTTNCHGVSSQSWSIVNNFATCVKCHGVATTSTASYLANTDLAAPGYNGAGVNTAGDVGTIVGGVSQNAKVGAHDAHNRGVGGYKQGGVACNECHNVTALDSPGHMDGQTTFAFGTLATTTLSFAMTPTYSTATGACQTNYCHGGAFGAGVIGTDPTPTWTDGAYLSSPSGSAISTDCNKCHLSPPTSTKFTHGVIAVTPTACTSCHQHSGSGPFHINGILYGAGACDTCHSYALDAAGDWGSSPKAIEGWGAHATHISHLTQVTGVTLSASIDSFGTGTAYSAVCGVCHTKEIALHSMGGTTNVRSITFSEGSTTYGFAGATAPTYSGVTNVSSGAGSPKTCSNVSCHFQTTPVWQGY